jgi:hypothetical protein
MTFAALDRLMALAASSLFSGPPVNADEASLESTPLGRYALERSQRVAATAAGGDISGSRS